MKLYEILMSDNIVQSINDNLEYLIQLIPEIKPMIGFDHMHPHHHLDVWNHTLFSLSNSEPSFDVRITLLLHDIGKPFSFQQADGIRHFKGHPDKSAEISSDILKRLNFDDDYINKICFYIKNHDTPIEDSLIERDYDIALCLCKIQKCDALAHNPEMLEKRIKYISQIEDKLQNCIKYRD